MTKIDELGGSLRTNISIQVRRFIRKFIWMNDFNSIPFSQIPARLSSSSAPLRERACSLVMSSPVSDTVQEVRQPSRPSNQSNADLSIDHLSRPLRESWAQLRISSTPRCATTKRMIRTLCREPSPYLSQGLRTSDSLNPREVVREEGNLCICFLWLWQELTSVLGVFSVLDAVIASF